MTTEVPTFGGHSQQWSDLVEKDEWANATTPLGERPPNGLEPDVNTEELSSVKGLICTWFSEANIHRRMLRADVDESWERLLPMKGWDASRLDYLELVRPCEPLDPDSPASIAKFFETELGREPPSWTRSLFPSLDPRDALRRPHLAGDYEEADRYLLYGGIALFFQAAVRYTRLMLVRGRFDLLNFWDYNRDAPWRHVLRVERYRDDQVKDDLFRNADFRKAEMRGRMKPIRGFCRIITALLGCSRHAQALADVPLPLEYAAYNLEDVSQGTMGRDTMRRMTGSVDQYPIPFSPARLRSARGAVVMDRHYREARQATADRGCHLPLSGLRGYIGEGEEADRGRAGTEWHWCLVGTPPVARRERSVWKGPAPPRPSGQPSLGRRASSDSIPRSLADFCGRLRACFTRRRSLATQHPHARRGTGRGPTHGVSDGFPPGTVGEHRRPSGPMPARTPSPSRTQMRKSSTRKTALTCVVAIVKSNESAITAAHRS